MNAFLLLCQCDSIANKVFAKAIPVIQETYKAGTNCSDVKIADAICKEDSSSNWYNAGYRFLDCFDQLALLQCLTVHDQGIDSGKTRGEE